MKSQSHHMLPKYKYKYKYNPNLNPSSQYKYKYNSKSQFNFTRSKHEIQSYMKRKRQQIQSMEKQKSQMKQQQQDKIKQALEEIPTMVAPRKGKLLRSSSSSSSFPLLHLQHSDYHDHDYDVKDNHSDINTSYSCSHATEHENNVRGNTLTIIDCHSSSSPSSTTNLDSHCLEDDDESCQDCTPTNHIPLCTEIEVDIFGSDSDDTSSHKKKMMMIHDTPPNKSHDLQLRSRWPYNAKIRAQLWMHYVMEPLELLFSPSKFSSNWNLKQLRRFTRTEMNQIQSKCSFLKHYSNIFNRNTNPYPYPYSYSYPYPYPCMYLYRCSSRSHSHSHLRKQEHEEEDDYEDCKKTTHDSSHWNRYASKNPFRHSKPMFAQILSDPQVVEMDESHEVWDYKIQSHITNETERVEDEYSVLTVLYEHLQIQSI